MGRQKEFSAKVPYEEYERFKLAFPQYGAVSWFINEALVAFNRKVAENPAAIQLIDEGIDEMVQRNRGAQSESD